MVSMKMVKPGSPGSLAGAVGRVLGSALAGALGRALADQGRPGGRGDVGVDDLPAGVDSGVGAPGDGQARRCGQPQRAAERHGQGFLDRAPAGLGGPPGKP